jgi:hypothetical protein
LLSSALIAGDSIQYFITAQDSATSTKCCSNSCYA